MKRIAVGFAFAILAMAILLPSILNVAPASAQNTGVTVTNVQHQVEIMFSGHLSVEDTVNFTGQATNGFLVGFPYKYGPFVLKVIAFITATSALLAMPRISM